MDIDGLAFRAQQNADAMARPDIDTKCRQFVRDHLWRRHKAASWTHPLTMLILAPPFICINLLLSVPGMLQGGHPTLAKVAAHGNLRHASVQWRAGVTANGQVDPRRRKGEPIKENQCLS